MFSTRQVVHHAKRLGPHIRAMSAGSGPLVDVAVDDKGIATVTMQRAPVNSQNLELLQEIEKALDQVSKENCKGMILTSGLPKIFSAGLDITEFYKPDFERLEAFCRISQDVWLKLFGSKFITAAAINGHAPAGGCLLAMSCEYRVMVTGNYKIGLNETALNVVASPLYMNTMFHTIHIRHAEMALTLGRLFPVEEALKIGLIDETGTDIADVIEKCTKFIEKFDRIPPLARSITKQKIRQGPIENLLKNRQQDMQLFIDTLKNPEVQEGLEKYMPSLKKKTAK